jgi:DNA-binding NtrC family response regulator
MDKPENLATDPFDSTMKRLLSLSPSTTPAPSTMRRVLYFDPVGVENVIFQILVEAGWKINKARTSEQVRNLLYEDRFKVGLIVLGRVSDRTTYRDVERLMSLGGQPFWIALLAPEDANESQVRRLIATYFFDYHTLPMDPQRLLITLGHAYGMAKMCRKLDDLNRAGGVDQDGIFGNSQPIQTLRQGIARVSRSDAPVLIMGASGTGKELTARAIHRGSMRTDGPFIAVNCGALPPTLIQAELFGHEKGAFTGAHHRRIGQFEAASGGTIFLDEIGDLPLELQVNLLRVLEQKTIVRVGSTEQIPVDVRVIAATHRNLEQAIAEREFREDLYYRLNVVQLTLPNLKDRHGDIELLAGFFLGRFTKPCGPHSCKRFSEEARRVMDAHPWPGNVRELINRVQRAVVMSEGRTITAKDLGLDRRTIDRRVATLEEARGMAERKAVTAALRWARHNVTQAAEELGISRATLYRLMVKYKIQM